MMDQGTLQTVEAMRAFNRFYTGQIGVLYEGLLDSKYPLIEARIIYELSVRTQSTLQELGQDLATDSGYLSRTIAKLEKLGIVAKKKAADDRRKTYLSLTDFGLAEAKILADQSRQANGQLIQALSQDDQARLTASMAQIKGLLDPDKKSVPPYILRPHRPGDMGKVISLHGSLYHDMFGWDETFEALVAEISADFIRDFNPDRAFSVIAEMSGEFVGSAFVVEADDTVCKLRMMIVDQQAQGTGLGRALLDECLRFARRKGYRKMTLWTNNVLIAARRMYETAGFKMVHSEHKPDFGVDLHSETWEMDL